MCERSELALETGDANRKLDALERRIGETKDNIVKAAKATEDQTKKSFKEVRGMMQASYSMVAGLTSIIGGDYAQIFANMYGIAISAVEVWQGIATAMDFSGIGTVQGILMTASLMSSIMALATGLTGQTALSSQIAGVTLSLQGFGTLLDAMPFG